MSNSSKLLHPKLCTIIVNLLPNAGTVEQGGGGVPGTLFAHVLNHAQGIPW